MKRFFQRFMGHKRSENEYVEERVNVTKEFGTTFLHYACSNNIEDVIKEVLDEGVDVDTIDNFGFTPLHLACERELINIVKILLKKGASTDIPTSRGETPLYIACDKGNIEIAKILLQYGANASIRTVREDTPLNLACKNRNVELVYLLLKNGAVREGDCLDDFAPLRYACESGDLKIVKLLFKMLPELSLDRSLHWACESRNYYLIEELIDMGANVNAVNAFGQTPLRIACSRRMYSVAKLLIDRKADVDIADMYGITPFKAIVRSVNSASLIQLVDMFAIVRLLVDNFADLSALSTKKDDKLVSMLLEDFNARIRIRVAFHVQDMDCLRESFTAYYNQYRPEYNKPIKMDLSNLSEVKDNLDKLEEMRCFVKKLKFSRDYVYLKSKLRKLLGKADMKKDEIKFIQDLFREVNKFCMNINTLRNTKVIESVVLPISKVRNK